MTPKLREVLDSPLPVSGLAMKVFATPFKGDGAERVGASRHRTARPRSSPRPGRQGGRDVRRGRHRRESSRRLHRCAVDGDHARDEDPRRRLGPPAVEACGGAAGPLSGSLRGARLGRRQRRIGRGRSRSPRFREVTVLDERHRAHVGVVHRRADGPARRAASAGAAWPSRRRRAASRRTTKSRSSSRCTTTTQASPTGSTSRRP